ncbi:hypothetical protein QTQ03_07165 [Micromonospora sp. WMMA1363]|uniref:hypothetical protein n=1 Tax=Micromonospora sp. WMMA1363 TaxID=3053985 RepID=UPI00259CB0D3|nr:hypothetical protein [Micromonospora sp. WMMA1363]MDM4719388.1 hypothetical protein [Micromonospora sp. WMMA1363]
MNTTLILGKILSLYLLTAGIAFIVATPFYLQLTEVADRSDLMAVNISGMVHLFVGFGVLAIHFTWGSLLAVLVTLLGIFFAIRGIAYYWIPQRVLRPAKQGRGSPSGLRGMGAAFVVYGGLMAYLSFLA